MTLLTIRLDSPIPITEQIVAALRQAIAMGQLRPKDELPPVRQLAADLGVNLNTVARAYRVLEAAGLVSTVRGRGTRVASAVEKRSATQSESTAEIKRRLSEAIVTAKLAGRTQDEIAMAFQEVLATFFARQLH